MNNIRIIGRLDIKGVNLIKGIQFEGLRVIGDPNTFAASYYKHGIDELIYMDTVATLYGRNHLIDLIQSAAKNIFVPITVGGGIRSISDAENILHNGADKIAINTAAIQNPKLLTEISRKFGSQSLVVSIEAKKVQNNKWEAYIKNGRERSYVDVVDWIMQSQDLGAGEILLTSVDNDGTRMGFDYELIDRIKNKINVPLIVSGGMGSASDAVKAINLGANAIALASLLHYKKISIQNIRKELLDFGINLREFYE